MVIISGVPIFRIFTVLMFCCFNFSTNIRFFVKFVIEANVNISHELNFVMFIEV